MIDDMEMDFERCYRAVDSRDQRFDGWFYTGVTSTGSTAGPSCPAITPKRQNVRFFPSAAAAQRAGFRACRRCRPDAAPGSPDWDVRADVVGRAMRLIGDGVVDRDGVPGLAGRLGYTERHLHRMLHAELGAGPLALARAPARPDRPHPHRDDRPRAGRDRVRRRLRQRAAVQRHDPRGVRRAPVGPARGRRTGVARPARARSRLRLPYRAPLHAEALLGLPRGPRDARRRGGRRRTTYHRALRLPHGSATVALTPGGPAASRRRCGSPTCVTWRRRWRAAAGCSTWTRTRRPSTRRWPPTRRCPRRSRPNRGYACRAPSTVSSWPCGRSSASRSRSPAARTVLARLVAEHAPPGRWRRARSRLACRTGAPAARTGDKRVRPPRQRRCAAAGGRFPSAEQRLATAARLGVRDAGRAAGSLCVRGRGRRGRRSARPRRRGRPGGGRARLLALPGIGPWTAGYIAMRALGDPDVFLPTDLGVRRGAAALGLPDDPERAGRPRRTVAALAVVRH